MFELAVNDTGTVGNSKLNTSDNGYSMDLLKKNMINCPTILKGMSHEMRTYMNAIVAFSFLMKEDNCNDSEREEFSNQILTSCELLIGLFDNFLDAAMMDTGNTKTELKICKLDNILDDALTEFRETMRKDGHKDMELITEIQYSNSAEVLIDKNKISRVIRSLFLNSIKNTKTGYIKIGYNFSDEKVNFHILDSGQGYFKCKEFLHTENMNESLSLYNDTYTAINITLAKKLIQMLDGTIWIECNGLTGTGIYFSVPAKKVAGSDVGINKFVNTMIAI
jgi:two-component system, sensor histidine kinase and response regulator